MQVTIELEEIMTGIDRQGFAQYQPGDDLIIRIPRAQLAALFGAPAKPEPSQSFRQWVERSGGEVCCG